MSALKSELADCQFNSYSKQKYYFNQNDYPSMGNITTTPDRNLSMPFINTPNKNTEQVLSELQQNINSLKQKVFMLNRLNAYIRAFAQTVVIIC
jgi:hypothetical protein